MGKHLQKIKQALCYNKKYTDNVINLINKYSNSDYIVFYNPECIGIMNATKDLFNNTIGLNEVLNSKEIDRITEAIIKAFPKQVIFSSITFGWKSLIENIHIKNNKIKIKFLWHGSHSLFIQRNEAYFLYGIMELMDRGIVNSVGFMKESMNYFYKQKGYNTYFVKNTIQRLPTKLDKPYEKEDDKLYIGLYSAGNRWEKNTFNQLSSIALIKNAIVDVVPTTPLVKEFCNIMNIKLKYDNTSYLPREELLYRMSQNDVNLYVTFTECAPVLPIESLELGVPCITGNNHHYFRDSEIFDYLVVKSEDDIDEIAEKINTVVENKEKIIELYKEWKGKYDIEAKESIKVFLES